MGNMVWNTRKLYGKLFGAMLVLRLTSECNMQCAYCYVAEDGQPKSCTKVVSMGSVRKMLEYLEGEKTCGLQLILTGGEPLLYKPLIREIVECAENLTIPHWIGIITNATLLDEGFLRYAKEKRIAFTISLDSPVFRYNQFRTENNRNLHERILENIDKALEMDVAVGINAVVNSLNVRHLNSLTDYCLEKGIRDFSLLPISDAGRAKETINHSVNCTQMCEAMQEVVEHIISVNETAGEVKVIERNIALLVKELMGIPTGPSCFSSPCGAGVTMLAMDLNGDIYPCDQYIGNEKMVLCNVENENIEQRIAENIALCAIVEKSKKRMDFCSECEHKICNGGCTADHIAKYGIEGQGNRDYWCRYYKQFYSYLRDLVAKTPEKAKWLTRM